MQAFRVEGRLPRAVVVPVGVRKLADVEAYGCLIIVALILNNPTTIARPYPQLQLPKRCIFLHRICTLVHTEIVNWDVEFADQFGIWWGGLAVEEQESIVPIVRLLEKHGPSLRFPYSSGIAGSRHSHMRELRIQHEGRPYRVMYAFDPRRSAILLIGGDKTGNDRWYDEFVPAADRIYDEHIVELEREGLI
jgi:hypothetical protein